jgi:hypothetical protein
LHFIIFSCEPNTEKYFGDNIKKNSNGEFWVALNSGREIQNVGALHETESVITWGWGTKDIVAAKYDAEGKVIGVLDGNGGNSLDSVSEVEEHNEYLWIGSAMKPYVGVIIVRIYIYMDNLQYYYSCWIVDRIAKYQYFY